MAPSLASGQHLDLLRFLCSRDEPTSNLAKSPTETQLSFLFPTNHINLGKDRYTHPHSAVSLFPTLIHNNKAGLNANRKAVKESAIKHGFQKVKNTSLRKLRCMSRREARIILGTTEAVFSKLMSHRITYWLSCYLETRCLVKKNTFVFVQMVSWHHSQARELNMNLISTVCQPCLMC